MEIVATRLILVLNLILLAVGLSAPMLTLEKFLIIENTFSVLSGILQLFREGSYFLGVVIALFSVVLPLGKLLFLFLLTGGAAFSGRRSQRILRFLHDYGRWSMLDVFVVAVLVVAVKLGVVAQVTTHYGLYAFAAAVLTTMALTEWAVRRSERRVGD